MLFQSSVSKWGRAAANHTSYSFVCEGGGERIHKDKKGASCSVCFKALFDRDLYQIQKLFGGLVSKLQNFQSFLFSSETNSVWEVMYWLL